MNIIDFPDDILIYISNFIKTSCILNNNEYYYLILTCKRFNQLLDYNYSCNLYFPSKSVISLISCKNYYCFDHSKINKKFLKIIFKNCDRVYNNFYRFPNFKRNRLLLDENFNHYTNYIHLDTKDEINNFEKQISNSKINIKFGERCCNRTGIMIKIPLLLK
jgi:hypothetical protein